MNRFEAALATAEAPALKTLDLSMFSPRDIANVALQRPEVLQDIDRGEASVAAWQRGETGPLQAIVEAYRLELVSRALGFVMLEYHALRPLLRRLNPRRILDIGAGYGFFDFFAHAEFGSEVILIDTEADPQRPRLFRRESIACTNLDVARRFFIANGGTARRILILNPSRHDLAGIAGVDLAVSFHACGFLFPLDGYRDLLRNAVRPGGEILIDLRASRAAATAESLAELGKAVRLGPAADGDALRMRLRTEPSDNHAAA